MCILFRRVKEIKLLSKVRVRVRVRVRVTETITIILDLQMKSASSLPLWFARNTMSAFYAFLETWRFDIYAIDVWLNGFIFHALEVAFEKCELFKMIYML